MASPVHQPADIYDLTSDVDDDSDVTEFDEFEQAMFMSARQQDDKAVHNNSSGFVDDTPDEDEEYARDNNSSSSTSCSTSTSSSNENTSNNNNNNSEEDTKATVDEGEKDEEYYRYLECGQRWDDYEDDNNLVIDDTFSDDSQDPGYSSESQEA